MSDQEPTGPKIPEPPQDPENTLHGVRLGADQPVEGGTTIVVAPNVDDKLLHDVLGEKPVSANSPTGIGLRAGIATAQHEAGYMDKETLRETYKTIVKPKSPPTTPAKE